MRRTLWLALAVAAVAAGSAQAQGTTGSINATASVVAALSVNGTDLAFGNVAPTSFKTIAPGSDDRRLPGRWKATGMPIDRPGSLDRPKPRSVTGFVEASGSSDPAAR